MVVMMYVNYPPSLQKVEDLLAERVTDNCHYAVRLSDAERPLWLESGLSPEGEKRTKTPVS